MADIIQKNQDEKFCADCGAIIKLNAEICPKCGIRQHTVPSSQYAQGRNRVGASLFALFLGGFGIRSVASFRRRVSSNCSIVVRLRRITPNVASRNSSTSRAALPSRSSGCIFAISTRSLAICAVAAAMCWSAWTRKHCLAIF